MISRDTRVRSTPTPLATYSLDPLAEHSVLDLAAALNDEAENDAIEVAGVRANRAFAELQRFSADVETLVDRLTPSWSRRFPVVEVSVQGQLTTPFIYYAPSTAALLEDVPLASVRRIRLDASPTGSQFRIALTDGSETRLLRVELPSDSSRIELAFAYNVDGGNLDGSALIASLNERPDSEIALLRAMMDSPAWIVDSRREGRSIPAYTAGLRPIDDALRLCGLYSLDAATRAVAARLAPTWRAELTLLSEAAQLLTQPNKL